VQLQASTSSHQVSARTMRVLQFAFLAAMIAEAKPSRSDLQRSQRAVPRDALRGEDHASIRLKLNAALRKGVAAMLTHGPCDDFTLLGLSKLETLLFEHRSPALFTTDLRAPRHATAESLRGELAEEAEYAKKHPEVFEALRDGKCTDIAMQWVHHLDDEARAKLAKTKFPLLPDKGTAEHAPELIRKGHHGVVEKLTNKTTCQIGHDAKAVARGTWEGFPAWPYEVSYNASGYGPYPFWTGTGSAAGSLTKGTPIQTHWSAVLNSERLDHGMCSLKGLGLGWTQDAPCTHLFLGTSYAYLFDQAQTDCCISSKPQTNTEFPPSGGQCTLTTMQRDFYKVFDYAGTVENYTSESGYYHGTVKKYHMHLTTPADFWFWYVTDTNDKPIEQGEGPCSMYDSSGSRNCQGPPHMLWHQYNPGTFKEAKLDSQVFAVPDVCKNTTRDCEVQPTRFCSKPTSRILV